MLNCNLFLHASAPNPQPEQRARCLEQGSSVGCSAGPARQSCNPAAFSLLHTLSKCIMSDTKKWPLETPRFPILLLSNCSSSSRLGHPQNRPGSPPGLLSSESRMHCITEALPTALSGRCCPHCLRLCLPCPGLLEMLFSHYSK